MLTLKNVRKTFGTVRVLDKVSFSVGEGQKIALVGQNGVGKSTLLKIIAGLESADKGEVMKPNRILIGYLPQEAIVKLEETLLHYLRRMTGLTDLENEMAVLETHLDEKKILEQYEVFRAGYERLGGDDFTRKAKGVLEGLGLSHIKLERLVSELSGGEKRKAALAGVLLRGVDVLLLDEPTNNLDLPALCWLERYLKRSPATCIIASHDRRFLDNVVKKVLEIDWYKRSVVMYTGGWSAFAEMKAHAIRKHKEEYRAQEEERATKKFTTSAKAMEERQKRLNKVERPLVRDPLIIPLESQGGVLKNSIVLKKVRFGYRACRSYVESVARPHRYAKRFGQAGGSGGFQGGPVDLKITFGSRLVIIGNNGAGKSTLLKTIAGVLPPLSGKRVCGEKLVFGYLMQEHENISLAITPYELFKRRLDDCQRYIIARHLSQFQFAPDVLNDKIAGLSPGERVRLIFALLSTLGANVLILDEPTNHLDLEAIEALEEALDGYGGTILLVTHDRRFLERIRLTQNFILENGKLASIENYAAYAKKKMPQITRVLRRLAPVA